MPGRARRPIVARVIDSAEDLRRYRQADATAHGIESWTWRRRFSGQSRDRVLRFQRRLRLLEYLTNRRPGPALVLRIRLAVLWRVHARHAERLGFTIPPNTFGPGLCLVHYGTVTVNPDARIGADCRVHPSSSIGRDEHGAPWIGDGCFVGPGARILGPVTLGSHVIVGANAVVKDSFGDHAVLAGVPARQVSERATRADVH
ncbi:MAG: serine acetyltransferase [Conexibacter sp.]|nr:serine acetyltransferase [Conexibacter sp.]